MKKITYSDSYQKNYRYVLTEPIGKNFDSEFKPELTPKETTAIVVTLGL